MKINNKLVKHYVYYDITMLTNQEREELAKEIDNSQVNNPSCLAIVRSDYKSNKWLACMTMNINSTSIKTILE